MLNWECQDTEPVNEVPHPEFETFGTMRINPVTGKREPFVEFWHKTGRVFVGGASILVLFIVSLIALIAVLAYKLWY